MNLLESKQHFLTSKEASSSIDQYPRHPTSSCHRSGTSSSANITNCHQMQLQITLLLENIRTHKNVLLSILLNHAWPKHIRLQMEGIDRLIVLHKAPERETNMLKVVRKKSSM